MTSLLAMLGIFATVLGVGYFLVSRVPTLLHTPLMSATNAISSITILGAFVLLAQELSPRMVGVVSLAVAMAAFNCVGGFLLTDRMFNMFKRKK